MYFNYRLQEHRCEIKTLDVAICVSKCITLFFSGNLYGNCCGKNCGGYEGGKPALEYAANGEFDNAPVTEWVRGQPAEVYWQQTAEHRGGYAYRLCKVSY